MSAMPWRSRAMGESPSDACRSETAAEPWDIRARVARAFPTPDRAGGRPGRAARGGHGPSRILSGRAVHRGPSRDGPGGPSGREEALDEAGARVAVAGL